VRYQKIVIPEQGEKITFKANGRLDVPEHPIIPYIEGDGIGQDVMPVMVEVINAAVEKAYMGKRSLAWMEVFAGEKANDVYRISSGLPEETLAALLDYVVSIKGPLTTPVGGGFRSLNVALRQKLDLYACVRPVGYIEGVPSPVKHPERTNMVIFRENSEDIYAGIEWAPDSEEAEEVIRFLKDDMHVTALRFDKRCGIGIKPVSFEGSCRLIRKAIQYAIDHDLPSVTLVHKGNIMKYTEGAFKIWGYQIAKDEFGADFLDGGPWMHLINPKSGKDIVIKDVIADAFLQQILLRPEDYSVIATLNLNGDYISDAAAACIGGIGMAPGANFSDTTALFEATHGTAPKYAGQDKVNPGSVILSAEMMLRHLGWDQAADLVIQGIKGAIRAKTVTYDLHRQMKGAELLSCSEFGKAVVGAM